MSIPSTSNSTYDTCVMLCLKINFLHLVQVEVIGGCDKYMATCRRCFNSNAKAPLFPKRMESYNNGRE